MTSQYLQTNINSPRLPRSVIADTQLNLDDELVVIEGGNPIITLPTAVQIPSREISIKSVTGTGTVVGSGGETIDGAASFVFSVAQESLLVKSDGSDWVIVAGGTAGGGAIEVRDEGVPVVAAATVLNFVGLGVTAAPGGPGIADITIPGGGGLLSGPLIPEGAVVGTPGDPYVRISGALSSFWQFAGAVPGVAGWVALGPVRTATPVGAIDGFNTSYSFPGGIEAVFQGFDKPQFIFVRNGIDQNEITDFVVVPGSVPGTTIVSFTTVVPPVIGDVLRVSYIPA